MSKSIGIRLLAGVLVFGTLLGGAVFGTVAEQTGSDTSSDRVGNLSDVLNTIDYQTYYDNHKEQAFDSKGLPVNKGASVKVDLSTYTATDAVKAAIESRAERAVEALGEGAIYLPSFGEVTWEITVEKAGFYTASFNYFTIIDGEDEALGISKSKNSSIERSLYIDGAIPFYEATYLTMSKAYRNFVAEYNKEGVKTGKTDILDGEDIKFTQDINNNQVRPETKLVEERRAYTFKDSTGYIVEPLKFYLSEGTHQIKLFAQRESVVINDWVFEAAESEDDIFKYEDYIAKYTKAGAKDVDLKKALNETFKTKLLSDKVQFLKSAIKYQAEYSETTSDITLYPTTDRTSCVTEPSHPSKQKLNTIGGGSTDSKKWTTVGQWIRYEVEESVSELTNALRKNGFGTVR